MEWIGHTVKLEHGWIFKESKPEGRRRMGRTRLRCLLDAEENLRQMKVKRCRQKTISRAECASVTKEGKGVRRSQSQGLRKKDTYCIWCAELHYTFRFGGAFKKHDFQQIITI